MAVVFCFTFCMSYFLFLSPSPLPTWGRVLESHYVAQTGLKHSVAQAVLEFMILLPQLYKCWNYRYVPPCPASYSLSENEECL
jgi:hypothetical protein